jgi:uncharacterized protein YndB with AHSA1/START domain
MFKWLFGSKEAAGPEVSGNKELLVVSQKVAGTPERAFAVFVDEIDRWWPRDLTWGKDNLAAIGIEPKMGGKCFECTTDGAISVWGTVLSIQRPAHIVIAWQVKADRSAEPDERTASRVDVRFVAVEGQPTTDVVVVHRDFPRHGDGWEAYRTKMASNEGWPRLISLYAKAVEA